MSGIGILTTTNEPLERIARWVEWHRGLGVDRFYIYVDREDWEVLRWAKDQTDVEVECLTPDYFQRIKRPRPDNLTELLIDNANQALEKARNRGLGWLIHMDGDEWLECDEPLMDLLAQVDSEQDGVRFDLYEFQPVLGGPGYPPRGTFDFRRPLNRLQKVMLTLLGCGETMIHDQFLFGHRMSKSAIRVWAKTGKFLIHHPEGYVPPVYRKIRLFHMHVERADQVLRKAERALTNPRLKGRWEFWKQLLAKWESEYAPEGGSREEQALKIFYRLTPWQDFCLRHLGLIEKRPVDFQRG